MTLDPKLSTVAPNPWLIIMLKPQPDECGNKHCHLFLDRGFIAKLEISGGGCFCHLPAIARRIGCGVLLQISRLRHRGPARLFRGTALGKLGVVRAPGRSGRLVLDNSTRDKCQLRGAKNQATPSALDVMHSFPLRKCQGQEMPVVASRYQHIQLSSQTIPEQLLMS